jgi:hypothetical protein
MIKSTDTASILKYLEMNCDRSNAVDTRMEVHSALRLDYVNYVTLKRNIAHKQWLRLGLVCPSIRPNRCLFFLVGKGGDGVKVAQVLVDHNTKDTHLGSTSVVELDGALVDLGLRIEFVPSEIDSSVTEVTREFVLTSGIAHHDLQAGDREGKPKPRRGRHFLKGGKARGDVFISRDSETGLGGEVTDDGKHGNTSVLELDEAEVVENFLVTVVGEVEGIEKSQRSQGTDLTSERTGIYGYRRAGRVLGRGKGGSAGNKGGNNNTLHLD